MTCLENVLVSLFFGILSLDYLQNFQMLSDGSKFSVVSLRHQHHRNLAGISARSASLGEDLSENNPSRLSFMCYHQKMGRQA